MCIFNLLLYVFNKLIQQLLIYLFTRVFVWDITSELHLDGIMHFTCNLGPSSEANGIVISGILLAVTRALGLQQNVCCVNPLVASLPSASNQPGCFAADTHCASLPEHTGLFLQSLHWTVDISKTARFIFIILLIFCTEKDYSFSTLKKGRK